MKRVTLLLLALLGVLITPGVRALDLTGGVMSAVPTPKPPVIDGDLSDWDLSAAEPVWISPQTAHDLNATVALMYDKQALYVGAKISLPGRKILNPNSPVDAFWWGDVLELRVAADPTLPAPLNKDVVSDRVAHLTFWKNSDTGKDYLHVSYGVNLDRGSADNPPGTQVVIKETGTSFYVVEAKIPWETLHTAGGVNPFAPGQRMTAVWSPHWGGERQVAALYRQNPGSFAFNQPQTWGQVEFSPAGHLKPRHKTMAEILTDFAAQLQTPITVGVPIVVDVPAPLKVSVNIFGPHGEVIRELMGGQSQPQGKLTVRWDGKDQWGHPMPPGTYKWGAYMSPGLRANFVAGVGKTATPYYETLDGKGGWGGDHSNPIDVAADATGLYFLWPVAESGRSVVKTDYAGHVLWRKTPFLGGGWGPLYALCADGKYVYLARGDSKPQLSRLDARTGQLQTWGTESNAPTERPISDTEAVSVPPDSSPLASSEVFGAAPNVKQPECVGLATDGREVFASVYSQNAVRLFNVQTGLPEREPAQINEIPGARGLTLDGKGDLYVVSAPVGGPAQIRKFTVGGNGRWQQSQVLGHPLVTSNLAAPWDVAVAANGHIFVSDLGKSQQIKEFGPDGKLLTAHGRPGGRPWAGKYAPDSFLNPAGIAADAQGGFLVAESSIPKVMSRWDVRTGKALAHWFGGPIYWDGTWPDTDPRTVYYQVNGGFARANLSRPGWPQAYWALGATDTPAAGDFGGVIPTVMVANNGKKYIVGDVSPNGVALIEGDKVLPVAHFLVKNKGRDSALGGERNTTESNYIEVWQDANGDHKMQPSEVTRLDSVGGKPLPFVADWFTHVSYMAPNGDFYFTTQANSVLKVPAASFQKDGSLRWDLQKAYYVVPSVLPAQGDTSYAGPRGQVGLQTDTAGDIYTALSATTPELTPALRAKLRAQFPNVPETHWGAYETNALREAMHEGLGHTGESNAVKIVKYAPDGHILWMAGRKATAAARPGEMYHFWALAGLVGKPGNEYIAAASEWGPFYVYTHDGFFVDTLMNDPGLNPPPGPYTFGSETGSGRIQYFPQQDQVWAYAVGMAYTVDGFKNGAVEGERRVSGTVNLDKVYETAATTAAQTEPIQIVPVTFHGNVSSDVADWASVPTSTLRRNGSELATAQIGYDAANLYVRFHVYDPTPLQNSADRITTAFKGGDTVGIVLGPGPHHDQPRVGDIRIMVAKLSDGQHIILMKPLSNGPKQPEDYFTPSSGHVRFDFVGEASVPQVGLLDADGKGYTVAFSVPRSLLELDLKPGADLTGDIEVRLSGAGPRGLQATSRNYLFTPQRSETSMTDDVPTEARLYPQYWGPVQVKSP